MSDGSKPASKKRCACGRSQSFPLCDGSHSSEGWTCSALDSLPVQRAFLAGPHLVNLAERLAHGMGGVAVGERHDMVRAVELVVLSDGSDVAWLRTRLETVDASRTKVIGIGLEPNVISWAFPDTECVAVPDDDPSGLWNAVARAVGEAPEALPAHARPRIFLSHAVADEGRIFPVLKTLRDTYGLDIFVCADSIPAGREWQSEIRERLVQCDLFLLLSSRSVVQSTYCAFEVGMATALGKPIRIIHLEERSTPPYLSHVQGGSIPRLLVRKPWLTDEEALLDGILDALGDERLGEKA